MEPHKPNIGSTNQLLGDNFIDTGKPDFLAVEGRQFHKHAIERIVPAMAELDDQIDWKQVAALLPELQRIRAVTDENRDG